MRLLDRYLLRELCWPLAVCLVGFLMFWISMDLFTQMPDFQDHHLSLADIGAYYALRAPELLVTILPIALLMGLLYAITNHARHHEIVAIRAAGISTWRLSAPYLGVGVSFGLLLFLVNNYCVPSSSAAAEQIRQSGLNNVSQYRLAPQHNIYFVNAVAGRYWRIATFFPATGEMQQPKIIWQLPDGSQRDIRAELGRYQDGAWTFYDVQMDLYPPRKDGVAMPERSQTNALPLPELSERPAQILNEIRINSLSSFKASRRANLSLDDILEYFRWHPWMGSAKQVMLNTLLHAAYAAPLTCLVVVIVALPFGLQSGRRNAFVGVAASIVICFAFFVLREFSLAMGAGGYLPAWLAAWLPNLIFGGGGLLALQKLR